MISTMVQRVYNWAELEAQATGFICKSKNIHCRVAAQTLLIAILAQRSTTDAITLEAVNSVVFACSINLEDVAHEEDEAEAWPIIFLGREIHNLLEEGKDVS